MKASFLLRPSSRGWLLLIVCGCLNPSAHASEEQKDGLDHAEHDDEEFFEFLSEFDDDDNWQDALDLEAWLEQNRGIRRNDKLRKYRHEDD